LSVILLYCELRRGIYNARGSWRSDLASTQIKYEMNAAFAVAQAHAANGHSPLSPNISELMKDWSLRSEEWEQFLAWLNPDRELAAQEYEVIRHRLIEYFNHRNCATAEDLTDQTIDRVVKILPSIISQFSGKPIRYCYGVARYIHKEHLRRQSHTDAGTVTETQPDRPQQSYTDEQEIVDHCLENCLKKLDAQKRQTFIHYYLVDHTKNNFRQRLADQLGITINALRLKMLRLKEELRQCITTCQQRETIR